MVLVMVGRLGGGDSGGAATLFIFYMVLTFISCGGRCLVHGLPEG